MKTFILIQKGTILLNHNHLHLNKMYLLGVEIIALFFHLACLQHPCCPWFASKILYSMSYVFTCLMLVPLFLTTENITLIYISIVVQLVISCWCIISCKAVCFCDFNSITCSLPVLEKMCQCIDMLVNIWHYKPNVTRRCVSENRVGRGMGLPSGTDD